MREILFRGKRLQGGNWVEGYFFKSDINKRERESGKATLIFTPDCDTFIMVPECHNSFMVVSDTVGQYTGLKDKNGQKIFEGDIVKCSDVDDCYYTEEKTEFCGVIKFEAGAFGIATKETLMIALGNWCENDNFVSLWELEWNEYIGNVEIIGNIHDNPELLENP